MINNRLMMSIKMTFLKVGPQSVCAGKLKPSEKKKLFKQNAVRNLLIAFENWLTVIFLN